MTLPARMDRESVGALLRDAWASQGRPVAGALGDYTPHWLAAADAVLALVATVTRERDEATKEGERRLSLLKSMEQDFDGQTADLVAVTSNLAEARALLREARESVEADLAHITQTRGKESALATRLAAIKARIDAHLGGE